MHEIIAAVSNVVRIKRDTVSDEFALALRTVLTRDNPAYYKMEALAARNPQKYRYTKMPPQIISTYDESADTIFIPRGAISVLVETASAFEYQIKWFKDLSFGSKSESGISLSNIFKPFPYQTMAINELLINTNGIIIAPCGAGKTVIGIAAMLMLGLPTLIVCHTKEIAIQWKDRIAEFSNSLDFEIGEIYDGKSEVAHITIGLTQSLSKIPQVALQELLATFGCIIIDECHHVPARTFSYVVNASSSMYRFGLTASKDRQDGLEFLMTDIIGNILYEVTDDDLRDAGRKQNPTVYMHNTGFNTIFDATDWTNLIQELTNDADRNNLIVNQVVEDWNNGHLPLILSDRTSHCRALKLALEARGMNIELLIGEIPKARRKKSIEKARNNLIDGLIGTTVADEGLDIENLSNLHITCPSDNKTKLQQRIGRICRPVEGKVSVVRDYVDTQVSSCLKKARRRKSFYKRWGFDVVET